MDEYLLTFRSITYAQRAERVLSNRAERVYLSRTPKFLSEQGCGYCVHLVTADIMGAVQSLNAASVPLRKVYRKRPGGRLEEVRI